MRVKQNRQASVELVASSVFAVGREAPTGLRARITAPASRGELRLAHSRRLDGTPSGCILGEKEKGPDLMNRPDVTRCALNGSRGAGLAPDRRKPDRL